MDKKAKKILIKTFWSNGWRSNNALNSLANNFITDDEYRYCVNNGYLFSSSLTFDHDEIIRLAKELVNEIRIEDVSNAFLYSLSSRDLRYRSALGSYMYLLNLPVHEYQGDIFCPLCNDYYNGNKPNTISLNVNVFNFERVKWGGARHDHISYAIFDLLEFKKLALVKHSEQDSLILINILECITELEPKDRIGKLLKLVHSKKIISTNKDELQALLGILSMSSILSSEKEKGYFFEFKDVYQRNPATHKSDYLFPSTWWSASDSYNMKALGYIFKELSLKIITR